ncbi:MAG: hypothetical protein GY838_02475 [bacterium]|nr:hypothetical protein [bacterium]
MQDDRKRPDRGVGTHPDLDLLLNRAGGLLDADTAARVDAHLEVCAVCRLESKRLARFEALETDTAAADEAGWDTAAGRLDHVWRTSTRPAVHRRSGWRILPRWLGPAAVAAAVACIALLVDVPGLRDQDPGGQDTMRGGPGVVAIEGVAPVGEVPEAPTSFAWETIRDFDAYDLEVFTEDLGTILRLDDVATTRVDVPDSLRAVFDVGTTYFWHVEGREGLSATAASASVWFRVVPPTD